MRKLWKSRTRETLDAYQNFETPDSVKPDEHQVRITVVPNGINHHYHIPRAGEPITVTPHRELLGHDISPIVYRTRERMDPQTEELYFALKALSNDIRSVSIEPYALTIDGPHHAGRDGRFRLDWTKDLDRAAVDCLAGHMGWDSRKTSYVSRRQTEGELNAHMDGIIIRGIAQGFKPPEGWPYH